MFRKKPCAERKVEKIPLFAQNDPPHKNPGYEPAYTQRVRCEKHLECHVVSLGFSAVTISYTTSNHGNNYVCNLVIKIIQELTTSSFFQYD